MKIKQSIYATDNLGYLVYSEREGVCSESVRNFSYSRSHGRLGEF